MKIILTDLTPIEFFENGGIVKFGGENESVRRFISDVKEFSELSDDEIATITECYIGINKYIYDSKDDLFQYRDIRNFLDPKDPYGIKNVNFTLINETDSRWEVFKEERLQDGFDDSETWSLDSTIAKFVYPRLKSFYNDGDMVGYPASMTLEEWKNIVGTMLEAFRLYATTDSLEWGEKENKVISKGLKLFAKHFSELWN